MQPARAFTLFAAIGFAVSLPLAGCTTRQKIEVVNEGPDGITLLYDSRYPTMAGVDADEHCAKFGKLAQRVETKEPSSADTITHRHAAEAVYACVEPQ